MLSNKEKEIIYNKDFLITKNLAIEKLIELFEETRIKQKSFLVGSNIKLPNYIDDSIGKIFKGENYKQLPYVVLEFPKYYSKKNVFTFRTMFWWGNFFSSTLHIEGNILDKYRSTIKHNIRNYIDNDIFLCLNSTPWEYHYENDNYSLLSENNIELINDVRFLKISKKFNLDELENIPTLSTNFLEVCLRLLEIIK